MFWLGLGAVVDPDVPDRVTAGHLRWTVAESRVDAHRILDIRLDEQQLPPTGREDEPFHMCMTAIPASMTSFEPVTVDTSTMSWFEVAHHTEAHDCLDIMLDLFYKQLQDQKVEANS